MLDKIDTLILENGKTNFFGENVLLYVCLENYPYSCKYSSEDVEPPTPEPPEEEEAAAEEEIETPGERKREGERMEDTNNNNEDLTIEIDSEIYMNA